MEDEVEIETSRFGKIKIDEAKIIYFTSGILGFPDAKRYVLIPHRKDSPFFWLQAVDVPELAFVVILPKIFFSDFCPELPNEVKREIHLHKGDQVDFLAIVTIPKEAPEKMTVNLLGPIVVNVTRRLARQVILDSRRYPLKEPLLPRLKQNIASGFTPDAEKVPLATTLNK